MLDFMVQYELNSGRSAKVEYKNENKEKFFKFYKTQSSYMLN